MFWWPFNLVSSSRLVASSWQLLCPVIAKCLGSGCRVWQSLSAPVCILNDVNMFLLIHLLPQQGCGESSRALDLHVFEGCSRGLLTHLLLSKVWQELESS